jgi:hypothetical protein
MLKKSGTVFFQSGESLNKLDNCVYVIRQDAFKNIFLQQIESFQYKELVGESKYIEELVVKHNQKFENSFGCLFDGISGMGKTQTIKNICAKIGLPVLFIDNEYDGSLIREVLDKINSDCVLFFDEFEKVYKNDSESLLPLFDGVKTKNKVITMVSFNETRKLSRFFFGRPGRFIFRFRFSPLTDDQAIEFILNNTDNVDKQRLTKFVQMVNDISYDICDKIVYLLNTHPDYDPKKLLSFLNVEESNIKILVSVYTENKNSPIDSFNQDIDDCEIYLSKFVGLKGYFEYSSYIKDIKVGEYVDVPLDSDFLIDPTKTYWLRLHKFKNYNSNSISFGY